jgi:UTP--glucose-1-phosphate uridylyltransferase
MSVKKAVFPAAGVGTRFLPASKSVPKEMFPLLDRPVIQYAVEEAAASGIEDIIVVTSRGKAVMEDHFDASPELEGFLGEKGRTDLLEVVRRCAQLCRISFIRQQQPLGLGHAVLSARSLVGDEPFVVVLPDDVVVSERPCIRQLTDVHEKVGGPVLAVEEVEPEDVSRYGIVDGEEIEPGVYRIRDMVEKPALHEAPSRMAIIGRYVLTPDLFEELESTGADARGEIQLTDAMRKLLKQRPFHAVAYKGIRHDAGSKAGFVRAILALALEDPELGEPLRSFLGRIL